MADGTTTFLITGVSSGLGRAVAESALRAGHRVVGTVRRAGAAAEFEVAPFGVRVTAIAPGGFRTDWSGRSMVRAPRSIADYDDLLDPIRRARLTHSGRQPGDPARAGDAVLAVLRDENPPVRLLLGSDALRAVAADRVGLAGEIEAWRTLSRSTDFPEASRGTGLPEAGAN